MPAKSPRPLRVGPKKKTVEAVKDAELRLDKSGRVVSLADFHTLMTRRYAQDAATATANGMMQYADKWQALTAAAKRILAEAEAREAHERDLVDQAKLDRSILGSEID